MAASDHLGAQWMPMHKIMGLTSVDAEADNDYRIDRGEKPKGTLVSDVLHQKRADIAADPARFGALRESMQTRGQTAPLAVNGKYFINGGHRVELARQMGWKGMHVSGDFEASEDREWNTAHPRQAWD